MGVYSDKNYDYGTSAAEREYAWEAAVHGVDLLAAWREFLAESVVAVAGDDDENWQCEEEDEEVLNKRAANQAAQDLRSADFAVRWDACRDLAKLQRAAAPHMAALAELIEREPEFDVKRVAKKALRELEKADREGWPNPPVRPERFEAGGEQEVVAELEKAGLPVNRLRSIEVAQRLFRKLRKLRAMDLPSLEWEYAKLGMPLEPGLSRPRLVERLNDAAFWGELEVQELRRACQDRQVPEQTNSEDETGQRCELASRLLRDVCVRSWEAQGVPVRRLGSFEAAAAVVGQRAQLERRADDALRRECTDRGFPMEEGIKRDELISRLGVMILWDALPLTDLQEQCAAMGPAAGGLPSRRACTEQLLLAHCTEAFAARGVPLPRLGSLRAAVRLSDMFSRLEAMSSQELEMEYWKLGILAMPRQRTEQLNHLRLHALWNMLPVSELSLEWTRRSAQLRDRGIFSAGSAPPAGETEQRKQLTEWLLLALCVDAWEAMELPVRRCGSLQRAAKLAERWARLAAMDTAELIDEATALGVPLPGLEHEERLGRMKTITTWMELPLPELQKECQALGVSSGAATGDDLLRRLCKAAKEQWAPRPSQAGASPAMAGHLKTLGLPSSAEADEVKRAFRQLALKYHPDKNRGESQVQAVKAFREVKEAYDILCRHMGLQSG